MSVSASISGTVTNANSGIPLGGIRVCAVETNTLSEECATTQSGGTYTITSLLSGEYEVRAGGGASAYELEYYNNVHDQGLATPVIVTLGTETSNIDFALSVSALPIAAGESHTVVIKDNGTRWAWGRNDFWQIGSYHSLYQGSIMPDPVPVIQYDPDSNFISVTAGIDHTLAIKDDGTLWGWGHNDLGQLGDDIDFKHIPFPIAPESTFSAVSAGGYFTLAIKTDGTLWAWGANFYSQLGDGTTETKLSPVQIEPGSTYSVVSAGKEHTVAIKTDGSLWAWGHNDLGQLGDGTTEDKSTPVQIAKGSTFIAVSAGDAHTLAVRSDGTLWGWGFNWFGQLGNGTIENVFVSPVQIAVGSTFTDVATGNDHSLAIKADGTLWAWGRNNVGQLGDGSTIDKSIPVKIATGNFFSALAARGDHSIAIKSDGTFWSWGDDYYGQVGNGSGDGELWEDTPVLITIPLSFSISGTVTDASTGLPLPDTGIFVYYFYTGLSPIILTDINGKYELHGLLEGEYFIHASKPYSLYIPEWYDNAYISTSATAVMVTEGAETHNIDIALETGGSISGTVADANSGISLEGISVCAIEINTSFKKCATTQSDGTYTILRLISGDYEVSAGGGASSYSLEYYNNVSDQGSATPVSVALGTETSNIDFILEELRTLTVSKIGSGTVTSTPSGIACGGDCSEDYPEGTSVTLTATPDSGWVFSGWSGACNGGGTCQVIMDGAKSVTAHFTAEETVTWTPSGIDGVMEACVNTPAGLATALNDAETDGQPNRIMVEQGVYKGVFSYMSTEDFDLELLGGYTTGCVSQVYNPTLTVLDSDIDDDQIGDGVVFDFIVQNAGGGANIVVDGFTFIHGNNMEDYGGCVRGYIEAGQAIVSGNIINTCSAVEYGGGIDIETDAAKVLIEDNIIHNNSAGTGGGIAVITHDGQVVVLNNTVAENTAATGGAGIALGIEGDTGSVDVTNNIIWGNQLQPPAGCGDLVLDSDMDVNGTHGAYIIDYNDANLTDGVCGSDPGFSIGVNNIEIEPSFVDALNKDFHIQGTSLVMNVGLGTHPDLPVMDIDGENRISGPGVDLGADEVQEVPSAVTLISPIAMITSATPSYDWNSSSGADDYRVVVQDTSNGFTKIHDAWYTAGTAGCGAGGECSVMPVGVTLTDGNTYRWYVQAANVMGVSSASAPMYFVCSTLTMPVAPTLNSPSGTGTATPTYSWNEVAGAAEYRIVVQDWSSGRVKVVDTWYTAGAVCSGGVCTVTPGTSLTIGNTYRWFVQARNILGTSPASLVKYFVVTVP